MYLAMAQMMVKLTPEENLGTVLNYIKEAKGLGADMVAFGEMIACDYDINKFPEFAMEETSTFLTEIAKVAKEQNIFVVAGSVPEKENGNIYNTTFVYDNNGVLVAKHRKVHLFDIDVKGGQYFKESDMLTAGNKTTRFSTPWGEMGLCICYDIRFPEFVRMTTLDGNAEPLFGVIVPGAFNMTTGPAHWQMNFRMRAMENQIYMAGVSPARDTQGTYTAWGHSLSVDPWGAVMSEMDETEGLVLVEWKKERQEQVRNEFPLLKHRRADLYSL